MASKKATKRPPAAPATNAHAAALIKVATEGTLPKLPAAAVTMLRELMTHNDGVIGNRPRIGAAKARQALKDHYSVSVGSDVFTKLIRHHFDRSWSGR